MGKIKEFCKKRREILMYLVFGVLTTLVGWAVYFVILWGGKFLFSIPATDTSSGKYLAVYTVAQIVQWIAAVLFAFFTNRAWVFTDAEKNVSLMRQLLTFSGGRVLTFGIDFVVTLFGAKLLTLILPSFAEAEIFGMTLNLCDIGAKVVAAVIVIICNYIFSKLFVFTKRKNSQNNQ